MRSFGERREKTMRLCDCRQTAKVVFFFFLCLNMVLIFQILMIRSSAQVNPLSATLAACRVHEVKLKERMEVFSFSAKSPSHLLLILNSHPPSYCGTVLAPGQDETFCPLPYSPCYSLSCCEYKPLCCALNSQGSVMEGKSLSY